MCVQRPCRRTHIRVVLHKSPYVPKRRSNVVESIDLRLQGDNTDADKVVPGEVAVPNAAGLVYQVDDVVLGRVLTQAA